MKRLFLVIISVSVLFFVSSCGQTAAPVGNEQAQAGSQNTPPVNEQVNDSESVEKAVQDQDENPASEDPTTTPKKVEPGGIPRFEDYPARDVFSGKTAPLKFTEETRMFRTRLNEAAKGPPNFGGRYIMATWGCGTDCLMGGVIDAKTGETTAIPFSICCLDMDAPEDTEKVDVRKDSRLVIFNGLINEEESETKTHYYLFENGKFTMLPKK